MNSELLELKAQVESFSAFQKKIVGLRAHYVGTFKQIDTYFNSPKGRFKLREVENEDVAKLIYYDREDVARPKKSYVLVIDIQEPEIFKTLFDKLLGTRVVISKKREIFIYDGTQIHLDTVSNLGTFIEFERKITNLIDDRRVLEELILTLRIEDKDLIQGSYSDIALENRTHKTQF